MNRRGVTIAATILIAGCSAQPPIWTVQQYLKNCEAVKAKAVRVAGYIGKCNVYDCVLYSDQPAAADIIGKPFVGIGTGFWFETKLNLLYQDSFVVVSGIADRDNCSGQYGFDGVSNLAPTDIHSWRPSEGAPPTRH